MQIFTFKNSKLQRLKEKNFSLEIEIQKIIEQNLETTFGLEFIKSEFTLNNLRIDTLAFDSENKTFVIIEYKRGHSFSVIDQGFAYLSLLLNQSAEFVLEYNEKFNKNLRKSDFDLSQSRILFIANSFTIHQQKAINFKNLPIELWEIKKFEDGIIGLNQIKSNDDSESIDFITKDPEIKKLSQTIRKYTVEDHFKEGWDETKDMYYELEAKLLDIDSRFSAEPTKFYIGFKIENSVIFDVKLYKSKLQISLYRVEPKDLDDPRAELRYGKNSYKYYNKHITNFDIKTPEDIDYAVFLAKQVHKRFTTN